MGFTGRDSSRKIRSNGVLMQIGIVGHGVVGSTMHEALSREHDVFVDDPYKGYHDDLSYCDVIFICVFSSAEVEEVIEKHTGFPGLLALRTTVPPGTTDRLIREHGVNLCYNPEFLTENSARRDFDEPDKVVVGTHSASHVDRITDIYKYLPVIMTPVEAEILKLSLNSFFALKVTFANEVYDLCEAYGGDYENVVSGMRLDRYVAPTHLDVWQDGYRGFGGKCLPKDARMFCEAQLDVGLPLGVVGTAVISNRRKDAD